MENTVCFGSADILLPRFIGEPEKGEKWAVIACDQHTSEPAYWKAVKNRVGKQPSTLQMILPEAFLSQMNEQTLSDIATTMRSYEQNVLQEYSDAMIYVRRTVSNGLVRHGIVGAVDLEAYDYRPGTSSPVRATEGTVLDRIPPRVAVRRAAALELPHVMLLIDDRKHAVIEPLDAQCGDFECLYSFDLMEGGGHIEGYLLPSDVQKSLTNRMQKLFTASGSSICFAVGDGNHSLASAKARYEELKDEIGDAALSHPLRYALCEVVNLHDAALTFEPIFRLVRMAEPKRLFDALEAFGQKCGAGEQSVRWIFAGGEREISLGAGTHSLTVGTLQDFLDRYHAEHPEIEIDYIHGEEALQRLVAEEDGIGFLFDGMEKEALFSAVEQNGALPRKTFSMGEACDKRYYIECRKITE